jgi:cytochrome c553
MKSKLLTACLATVLAAPFAVVEAEQAGAEDGAELFKFHGCVNCHGADGRSPVSKMVPELAGKSADDLYSKATKILSGEEATDEAKIMHAAFYSPSSCDAPPTEEQLKSITSWLSSQ